MSKIGRVYTEKPTNPMVKAPFGRVLDTFHPRILQILLIGK